MSDQLYLSYWLRGFNERNMLRSFAILLRRFPFSTDPPGVSTLRIYALEYSEPAVLETSFEGIPQAETVARAALEFQNPDCAYLVGGYWDLWQEESGWKLVPAPVVLGCYGPLFQNDLRDHLRLELGLDSHFLARPQQPASSGKVQSNIQSVLRLSRELDEALPVEKRNLWTESGEDFAQRLRDSVLQPFHRGAS